MKQGESVLITGATGFIGGWLALRLAQEQGVAVRGLARTPAKGAWLAEQGVEIVQGDITDPASVAACAWTPAWTAVSAAPSTGPPASAVGAKFVASMAPSARMIWSTFE